MQKRYFCFECGTNVLEEKMENRIAGWFGICISQNNIFSLIDLIFSMTFWIYNVSNVFELQE